MGKGGYKNRKEGKKRFVNKVAKYAGAAHTAWSLGKKAIQGVQYLRGLINVEYKYADAGITTDTPTNAGNITYLSGIAQGDGNVNRDGTSVLMKSLYMRWQINMHASAVNTVLRMIIFVDTENRGALPAVTDILQTADARAFMVRENGTRFNILHDKLYIFNINTNAVTIGKLYKKLFFHSKYTGSSAAVTAQLENGVFILLISDQATNTPTVVFNTRMRFIDN